MKEIFLSFRPEFAKPLLYGMKKYEYRKRFCDEETKAYLYLSGKSRQVIGIMELGKSIRLDLTREKYLNYPETLSRVDKYILNKDIHAVPIKSLALFDKPISLDEIREVIPNFMPPQMYYVLENHLKLKSILEKRSVHKKLFTHKHDEIYYDNLAISGSEFKKTEEFNQLQILHKNNSVFHCIHLPF